MGLKSGSVRSHTKCPMIVGREPYKKGWFKMNENEQVEKIENIILGATAHAMATIRNEITELLKNPKQNQNEEIHIEFLSSPGNWEKNPSLYSSVDRAIGWADSMASISPHIKFRVSKNGKVVWPKDKITLEVFGDGSWGSVVLDHSLEWIIKYARTQMQKTGIKHRVFVNNNQVFGVSPQRGEFKLQNWNDNYGWQDWALDNKLHQLQKLTPNNREEFYRIIDDCENVIETNVK